MLFNYLTIAFRHLIKDRIFSLINVIGLSLGVASCVLIFQYGFFELQYDRFHKNADNLYRISTHYFENGQLISESASSSSIIASIAKDRFPEVVQSARLMSTNYWFDCTLKFTDKDEVKVFHEKHLYYADPSFLSMFTYPFEKGDPARALSKPFSIVLSHTASIKYFGDKDPIGKILFLQGSMERNNYTVTGVMKDPQQDSHIDADILLSMSSLQQNKYFKDFDCYTYLLLSAVLSDGDFNKKISTLASVLKSSEGKIELGVHPIRDIHLHQSLQDEMKAGGNSLTVYFLLLVALTILLIAWINYINLTTARSLTRAKEVGIRKVSGASRLQLSYQFLTEALIINIISLGCGMVLVPLFSSRFYTLTGLPNIAEGVFNNHFAAFGYFLIIIFFAGVCLTGLYPARLMSSFNPSLVLKGKYLNAGGGLILRKSLVIFQFGCSIGLTTAVIVFGQQFRHMQNMDLGIDVGQTIVLKAPADVDSTYKTKLLNLKSRLKELSMVRSVTTSTMIPGETIGWTGPVRNENDLSKGKEFVIDIIDQDFIETYKLKLLSGRNFSASDFPILNDFGAKLEPVILNKLAIVQLGFSNPIEAIGRIVFWNKDRCVVVGVVDDFHQATPKYALQPTLFTANNGPNLSIKLERHVGQNGVDELLSTIHHAWNLVFPDNAFDYFFLDDFMSKQYAGDEQVANLFQFFCWLAIIISGLGLFGLSSFTFHQRTKEVSIRKVLGASAFNLFKLLTREFVVLILIASLLALPLSYVGISRWLSGFVFRIQLNVLYFIFPVAAILLLSLLTVSIQTIKAINVDPAQTLKQD